MQDIEPIITFSFAAAGAILIGGICGWVIFRWHLDRLRCTVQSEIAGRVEEEVLSRFQARRTQHFEVEGTVFKSHFLIIKDTLYYDNFPTALCESRRIRVNGSVDTESIGKMASTITTAVQQLASSISEIKSVPIGLSTLLAGRDELNRSSSVPPSPRGARSAGKPGMNHQAKSGG
jgi:hypothetical protein